MAERTVEKAPAFVVVDRRKFTSEGEIREGYTPPPVEVPSALEPPLAAPAATSPARVETTPSAVTPKVVTMPTRSTVEADDFGSAEDLREQKIAAAGYDVDGDGLASYDEVGDYEDENAPAGPPPTAAETSAQHREYQRLGREMDSLMLQANPGIKPAAAVGFEHIVQNFYLSAIMAMGAGTEPGQKPHIDILGARQSIDMLNILGDKTRGNLDGKEQRLLDGVTFELRMMFIELTNAIAAQAQQAPPLGRK